METFEEWDCNKLQDANGNSTNPEAVCDLAHKNGLDIFSIILSEWLPIAFFAMINVIIFIICRKCLTRKDQIT